jgi:hypothetical protein
MQRLCSSQDHLTLQRRFKNSLQVRTSTKFDALLQEFSLAAAMRRDVSAAGNERRDGAVPGPSATRKRTAGVAPIAAAPPKNQAMRREVPHERAQQEDDVQLPSQLSQKTAVQPLNAIGRRAGRGSRMAAMVRRLS